MEKPTNLEQFSKLLLNKFLIHFVPGVILFFGFLNVIRFHLDRGLLAFVIVASFSWTLGLILEIVFFRKKYQLRIDDEFEKKSFVHYLLISKTGLAIILVIGINVFMGALQIFEFEKEFHLDLILILAIKTAVFGGFGLFLFLFFKKGRKD